VQAGPAIGRLRQTGTDEIWLQPDFAAIAGYLALLFKGPRATFWIALLYGLGIGLTFDEFGFWFNPPRAVMAREARWQYTGILVIVSFFLVTALLRQLRSKRPRS